jgi:hypothetical protein
MLIAEIILHGGIPGEINVYRHQHHTPGRREVEAIIMAYSLDVCHFVYRFLIQAG